MMRTNHLRALLALVLAAAVAAGLLLLTLAVFGGTKPAEAQVAPPTGKIAFQSDRDGNDEIYVRNADGKDKPQRLTNSTAFDIQPDYSPDGTRIAFVSTRDGNFELYVMDAVDSDSDGNGDNLSRLTNHSALDSDPHFSPDGSKIAFTSFRDSPNGEIYMMNAAPEDPTTNPPQRLTKNLPFDARPDFSNPDGTRIAFTSTRAGGNAEIFSMLAAPENPTTNQPINLTNNPANDDELDYSPDGTRIAFVSNRTGTFRIFTMNSANGSEQTQITRKGKQDRDPDYSPDGTKIAYAGLKGKTFDIYTINADGSGKPRKLKNKGNDTRPSWGPAPPTP